MTSGLEVFNWTAHRQSLSGEERCFFLVQEENTIHFLNLHDLVLPIVSSKWVLVHWPTRKGFETFYPPDYWLNPLLKTTKKVHLAGTFSIELNSVWSNHLVLVCLLNRTLRLWKFDDIPLVRLSSFSEDQKKTFFQKTFLTKHSAVLQGHTVTWKPWACLFTAGCNTLTGFSSGNEQQNFTGAQGLCVVAPSAPQPSLWAWPFTSLPGSEFSKMLWCLSGERAEFC